MKANCLLTINPDSTNQLALLRKVNPRASASNTKKDSYQMIALIGVSYLKKKAATYSPVLWTVPSARPGLTSLFGMVRGGTPVL